MASIFNKADCEVFINRINTITPSTKPLWGKMNATQMMAHCIVSFNMATGKIIIKRALIGYFLGGLIKKQIMNDKPFKKSSPTAKEFIIPDGKNFEEEKNKLIAAIHHLCSTGACAIIAGPHPFFGSLTTDEWDKLTCKHLDHHLTQFGG